MKDKRFNFYSNDTQVFDVKNAKDRVILNLIKRFDEFEYYLFESQKSIKHAFILIGFAYVYFIAQIIRWFVC